jgi:DNA primase
LPEGRDPDEVALADPEEWKKIISSAKPIVVHVMDTLAHNRDLNDPKEKREIARQVLPLINDVPNPVEREDYRQKLARLLKVDENAISSSSSPQSSARPRRRAGSQRESEGRFARVQPLDISAESQAEGLEKHILGLLLLEPGDIFALDRALQKAGLARLRTEDFELSANGELARIILQANDQDEVEVLDFIATKMDVSLQGHATAIKSAAPGDISPPKRLEDLIRSVLFLRLVRMNLEIERLRFLQEDSGQADPGAEPVSYHELIFKALQTRAKLDSALSKPIIPD